MPRRCALSFHLSLQSIVYYTDAHWWRWLMAGRLNASHLCWGYYSHFSYIGCRALLSQSLLWPNTNCCNGIWSLFLEILSVGNTEDLLRSTDHKTKVQEEIRKKTALRVNFLPRACFVDMLVLL